MTGPSSANSAGWPEVTTHYLPIGMQMALNGYAITLDAWRKLKPDQQQKLQATFDAFIEDVWKYSEELFVDASNCNVGKDPCTTGKKFNAGQRAGDAVGSRHREEGRARPVVPRLGRGVRQVEPRLLGDVEADRRPDRRDEVIGA